MKRGSVRGTRVAVSITAQKSPLLQYCPVQQRDQFDLLKPLCVSLRVQNQCILFSRKEASRVGLSRRLLCTRAAGVNVVEVDAVLLTLEGESRVHQALVLLRIDAAQPQASAEAQNATIELWSLRLSKGAPGASGRLHLHLWRVDVAG